MKHIPMQIGFVLFISFAAYADDAVRTQSEYVAVQECDKQQTKLQALVQCVKKTFIPSFCVAAGLYVMHRYNKENAFNVISTLCTLLSLYLSYENNYEFLRLSRASFIIDKGATAFKNLPLVDAEKYDQFEALRIKGHKDSSNSLMTFL